MLTLALGATIGLILALTGAGGGILAVPLLVMGLHLPIQEAAPIGLLAVGLASAVGAWIGLQQGIVRYKAALLIGGLGMLSAPLGNKLAHALPSSMLMAGFGLLMLWLAWRQWHGAQHPEARTSLPPCVANPTHGRLMWTSPCARALAGTGVLSGLLSGLIGVGGGFVIVPALSRHSDLPLASIQATSLAVIALVSASATLSAAAHGHFNAHVASWFATGAVLALAVGRLVATKLPKAGLQKAFALTCAVVAVLMLHSAFINLSAPTPHP